jgi:hypothetical protein
VFLEFHLSDCLSTGPRFNLKDIIQNFRISGQIKECCVFEGRSVQLDHG